MSHPPTRLSVAVQSPGGRPQRWAEDEYRPENVPGGLQFSTTIPGGDERFSCSLARRAGDSSPDLQPLSTVKVLGAEGGVRGVFELESAPASSGDELSVSPQAVGFQAELERRSDCSIVFVDRDLSAWVGASAARREALYSVMGTGSVIEDPSVDPDASGLPQLVLHNDGQCGSAMISEAWLDAGPGSAISDVYFDYVGHALGAGWSGHANSAADDTNVAAAGTDVVAGSVTPTGTHTETFATPRRYAMFDLGISAAQTVERNRRLRLRRVAAWGPDAIKRGTAPDDGVYSSEAIGTVIERFVPRVRASTTGPLPSIQATGFVNSHLSFREPTTPLEMIEAANRSQQWDWEVKWGQDGPTFYYHPPGGKRWRTRIGPSNFQETGQDASRMVNGVVVTYTDVDGTSLRVGPPGSGADVEDASLADPDPENPANKVGLPFYAHYEIGVSTAARAIEIGARVLALYKQRDRSGSAQLVAWVEDSGGRLHPSSVVRAGDEIAFADASDTSYRRIVRTDYDHPTLTNTIDLDAPPIGLDALIERFSESNVALGVGA